MNRRQFVPLLLSAPLSLHAKSTQPDWPQWRGPRRDGISQETGLLKTWAEGGPKVVWSINNLGEGYGTVAIQGDQILVQGVKGEESVLFCLNRADGKTLWTRTLAARLEQDRGPGPRGTPTIDGDRIFVLAENGELQCMKLTDGAAVWRKNILTDFGGRNPKWHLSESPLVDGNKLIVTPGGSGAGIVALDKTNGKTLWQAQEISDTAGYSSCLAADVGGVRVYMTVTSKAGVGVRASDGKLMWSYAQVANRTANVATAIFHEDKVFYSTAYGTGCALLGLKAEGGEVKASEIYFNREMMNHHGGVVLHKGYLYGSSAAILTCMEFATGKVAWKDRGVGKGSVTYADGMLYLVGEGHMVGLAEATPDGYRPKGQFSIEDHGWPSWAHPVVCGGKLYVRNWKTLACYDVTAT